MEKTPNIAELEKDLLAEAAEDHRGLWVFLWPLSEEFGVEDPEERRKIAQEMVSGLLKDGLIRAGFPTPDGTGFEPWDLSADEAIARVASEWDALGREPDIGDVAWFEITDEGRKQLLA